MEDKKYYLHCDCIGSQADHMAMFWYYPNDKDWDFIFMEVHMVHTPFFKRIWKAVRYLIFGELDYGHWHEIVVNRTGARELIEFLEGYLDNGSDI